MNPTLKQAAIEVIRNHAGQNVAWFVHLAIASPTTQALKKSPIAPNVYAAICHNVSGTHDPHDAVEFAIQSKRLE